TPAQVADALRGGDVQVVDIHGGGAVEAQLSKVGGVQVRRVDRGRALSLTLNARAGGLGDPQVRRAALSLLDPGQLALVGAGSHAGAKPVESATAVPSDPG